MDGTCLVVDEDDRIVDFIPGKLLEYSQKERYYKTVNIYKLSADFSRNVYVPFLEAYARVMGNNEYYEAVIKLILMLDKNTMRQSAWKDSGGMRLTTYRILILRRYCLRQMPGNGIKN